MRIWFALIGAPLLALTDQSVAFALVGWACAHHSAALAHAPHVFCLAVTAGCAFAAWRGLRGTPSAGSTPSAAGEQQFLARLATAIAALSTLAIMGMWIASWMISPCVA